MPALVISLFGNKSTVILLLRSSTLLFYPRGLRGHFAFAVISYLFYSSVAAAALLVMNDNQMCTLCGNGHFFF